MTSESGTGVPRGGEHDVARIGARSSGELAREVAHCRKPRSPTIAVMCGRLDTLLHRSLAGEGVRCLLEKPFQLGEFEAIFALLPARKAAAPVPTPC